MYAQKCVHTKTDGKHPRGQPHIHVAANTAGRREIKPGANVPRGRRSFLASLLKVTAEIHGVKNTAKVKIPYFLWV